MTPSENLHKALRDLERAFLDHDKLDILAIEFDRKEELPVKLRIGVKKEIPRQDPIWLVGDVETDGRDVGDAISNISFRLGAKMAMMSELTAWLGPR